GRIDHGLDSRSAKTIDGERRHLLRHTRLEPDVTRAVDRVARRLQRVSDDDVVDLIRRESAAAQRFLCGDRSEIDCTDVGKVAVVLGHGSSCTVYDEDVFHALSETFRIRIEFLQRNAAATNSIPVSTILPS